MRGRSGGSLQGDPGLMIDGKIPVGRIHTCREHSSRHANSTSCRTLLKFPVKRVAGFSQSLLLQYLKDVDGRKRSNIGQRRITMMAPTSAFERVGKW